MQYSTIARTVNAVHWTGDNLEEVKEFLGDSFIKESDEHQIEIVFKEDKIEDAVLKAEKGEYIVYDNFMEHFLPMPEEYFNYIYISDESTWLDRVKTEIVDYRVKNQKLHKFLTGPKSLEKDVSDLLWHQYNVMNCLIDVLQMRIDKAEHPCKCCKK